MTERVPDAMHQIDIVFPHGTNVDLEPDEDIEDAEMQSLGGSDVDSALGESEAWPSSTASLRSSIVRAREENGRIYHGYKDGKYVLPTDQEELDRQGEAHPEAEVVGVDLSPVQPGFTPPNVHYEIDDLEEEWSFSRKFDYVHCMMMTGAFRDWQNFHQQAFDNLNPGGWFEIQDIDFPMRCDDETIPPDCDLGRWNELMMEAGQRSGFLLDTCGRAAEMMASVGFVDIVRIQFKWPINQWPRDVKHKTLGVWTEANFSVGLESMTLALFTRFMGWRKEEVWDFSANVIAEWRDVRRHGYFDVYVTYGRKP
ncbi:methyltransferase [Colletotrichum paranaense]|uniref:Methyltransferase n=3 Tax=Colletotrichum acutatum species complex TaxID=2707335 RepID=A0AAI9YHA6_9PEZI|nr:methyltransferase [Colletotrichum costaricense]XP_060341287.1 methyltransferase [Colletotrichum paranaense]XP_060381737.1 methyltransferase [Colletotrichum tamarilloi]KAK1498024.1 methyltransferase [Colletotrichum tamarilloi]KAK1509467.1 methyltransferase [Colletotrichum costaricense]KAK1518202.1 methyltransferase [Colletotrichum paranaense]